MMVWFVNLVTNWFSTLWRLITGAFALAGHVGMDDDDFLRLEWPSESQREFIDQDHR